MLILNDSQPTIPWVWLTSNIFLTEHIILYIVVMSFNLHILFS